MEKMDYLIKGLYTVSNALDKLSLKEKIFPADMVREMESISFDVYRMANALKDFRESLGRYHVS